MSAVAQYLSAVQRQLKTGHAQEHTYRPALETLFTATTKLHVLNEPKGSAHGRPDFIFLRREIPIAWAEAKDLDVDLDKKEKGEQVGRYFGYANLILTNGLEFRFYKNGIPYGDPITIGRKFGQGVEPQETAFDFLEKTLAAFVDEPIQSIRSAEELAKIMGGKAKRLRDNIVEMMDPSFTGKRGDIESVMDVIKKKIIHDLTPEQFADLYAQTLVYGLFVARYNDDSPQSFSRMEARESLPPTNHLLQQFFDHIAGANFVKKLSYIVDELCDVFKHSDVRALVHGLYLQKNLDGETHDPIIHFYEDFLTEYNPELRKRRGVFYTPLPVVRYIVRSVDILLKEKFGLFDGLADTSSIDYEYSVQEQKKKAKIKIDRVQILDPAVGTGTFLNEVIREVHAKYKGQEGAWNSFVREHLVPRLNGFELMMASYTIAHLKLSMTLAETGVKDVSQRLRVFLANSLEEALPKDDSLFAGLGLDGALTEEAIAADGVKRDLPIMIVMGNPPYSGHSANEGEWIEGLLDVYKKEPGGGKLKERNSKWLNDDYVKFLRLAEHFIEKNGHGIVAFITSHSYLDNPTFRGMRWQLRNSFNEIYILDLHGNQKKKEKTPDGRADENVFDIKQGVCIILAVKSEKTKTLGKVFHADLWGGRYEKYDELNRTTLATTKWQELSCELPQVFFVPKNFEGADEYAQAPSVQDLFHMNTTGIQTGNDDILMADSKQGLTDALSSLAQEVIEDENIQPILYRPFDSRWAFYIQSHTKNPYKSLKIPESYRPRFAVMQHMKDKNVGLIVGRQGQAVGGDQWNLVFSTTEISDLNLFYRGGGVIFPLYSFDALTKQRVSNLNPDTVSRIVKKLGLSWNEEDPAPNEGVCGPQDIFDYAYAVLHSPSYRKHYKEFLNVDFPRIPYTSNKELFQKLATFGAEIRWLHGMSSPKLHPLITSYPITGSDKVEKIFFDEEKRRVYINDVQYIEGVDRDVWGFHIGGYQVLDKWLKDRKGKKLSNSDLNHYQRIVIALKETIRLMAEIDAAIGTAGGWPLK